MKYSRHAEERGAALIVAIAVMTILLAISLTFFTVSRLELKTATNVENTVKAELLANAATNIAISFLNHDLLIHPTFTSLDHAWRTYFNGAWVAGKGWAFGSGVPWSVDPGGYVDILYADPDLWPVDTGGAGMIGHVYVPRKEALPIDDPMNYDDTLYPFVVDPGLDTHRFTAAQIGAWADVDNDQDGYRDSMWIPLVADTFHGNVMVASDDPAIDSELIELGDRIDNDLDLGLYDLPAYDDPALRQVLGDDSIEEINETAPFLYYGGSDGLDNDGDGAIDEDDERWGAAMGLDTPRFFLTAPLNAADGTYLVLQNVPILDAASAVFRSVNIDCSPDGGWVDVIDNDFDLITNKHTEYYTRADGTSVSEPDNRILNIDQFNNLRGVYEISPRYLADKDWRIKSTGEPVCELVGRAAILVTDEASKVNINASGGHSLDVPRLVRLAGAGHAIGLTQMAEDDDPTEGGGWWRSALGQGVGPQEYYTQMLPRVGPARARKLWHYLAGAPNGSQALGPLEDLTSPPQIEPEFVADSVLPGYGFVDDDGDALRLAMNGIDDDGDGLIDEGVNDGTDLSQEAINAAVEFAGRTGIALDISQPDWLQAQYVYRLHLGQLLEGVDEPGEFRQRRPHRNAVAEGQEVTSDGITFDNNDNDLDAVSNEVGEMADRVFRTRQELKRIVRNEGSGEFRTNANTFFERLRNFVTLHSVDAGNRYQEAMRMGSALAPPFELYPILKTPVSLKLNYAYARGDEVAEALQEGWDLRSPTPEYFGGGEIGLAAGLQQEGVTLALDPPVLYEVPPFIDQESGFTVNLGWHRFRSPVHFLERCPPDQACAWRPAQDNMGNLVPYYADPGLRSLRLGATLRDFADTDYARTELTMAVDEDVWWSAMLDEAGEAPEIRPIQYTVSGFEGVRITEMMVRPVRRIEAEMTTEDIYFNPNLMDILNPDLPPLFGAPGFKVDWLRMQELIDAYPDRYEFARVPPLWGFWPDAYPPNLANPSLGYLGSGAAMITPYKTIGVTVKPDPGDPAGWYDDERPNIIEYVIGPSPGLPPGRYYLTINTTSWQGDPSVIGPNEIMVATKYVSATGAPMRLRPELGPDSPVISVGTLNILDDVEDFFAADLTRRIADFWNVAGDPLTGGAWQTGEDEIFVGGRGYDFGSVVNPSVGPDEVERTGWVFVAPGNNALPDAEVEGYGQDIVPHAVSVAGPPPDPSWILDPNAPDRPTFTVLIPHYADITDPDDSDQVFLHVAVCMSATFPDGETLALNFFDFSQEPDHEWIEIENVSGREIDVSGWELIVGAVDHNGDTVSEDAVKMRIPPTLTDDLTVPVVLGAYPPFNRLLLAVNARDVFEYADEYWLNPATLETVPIWPGLETLSDNLLDMNGIGLVGADVSDGPDADDLDYGGVTFPMIPCRHPGAGYQAPGPDGRGMVIPFRPEDPDYVPYVFEDPVYQGGIVQLAQIEVSNADDGGADLDSLSRDDPKDIAYWVLRGGVFPNYPEHDGVDNDADGGDVLLAEPGLLEMDGVDNDGDGEIDEFRPEQLIPDIEGIDEGRWRMDGDFALVGPQPGSFNGLPIHYHFISDYHDYFNYEELFNGDDSSFDPTMYYLTHPDAPPEWKEFVERRFFPGDNVVVTLYDVTPVDTEVDDGMGGTQIVTDLVRRGPADRVTYTERDVINRAIDDVQRVDELAATAGEPDPERQSLHGSDYYQTFWPDNTMGVDFYRTLERRYHPLYAGDRFGTQNRWQATDGNYDDWSHDPVLHQPVGDMGLWPGEKWFGSPLKPNAAAWDLDDVDMPSPDTDAYLLKLGQEGIDHLNRRPASVGDVLSMPYFSMTKTYVYFEGTGEFGRSSDYWTGVNTKLGVPRVGGLLLGQSHPGDLKALVSAGSSSRVRLSCAQAEFRVIGVNPADLDTSDLGWGFSSSYGRTVFVAPGQWAPLFLYQLGDDDDQAFEYWVGLEKRPQEPISVSDTLVNFLFNAPPLPSSVLQDDLVSRWPIGERAVLYASPNLEGFGRETLLRDDPAVAAAQALFIWDGADGLEDGEYNLYIDTGGRLDGLIKADDAYYEHVAQQTGSPPPQGLLTLLGRWVANEAAKTKPVDLLLDVEVFTDRDGDGRCWQNLGPPYDTIIDAGELRRGPEGDSFGGKYGLTPDWDGYIHYGIVRIENNYLAVFLRNWAPVGRLNRFAGVVLAPRDPEPGRVNVNTAVTRDYADDQDTTKAFNALMGVPGILRDEDGQVRAEAGPDVGMPGVAPILPSIPDGTPIADANQRLLGRAQLVEVSRPSHWDGRYYMFLSDLVADDPNVLGTYPLSTLQDDLPRMHEVTWRFSQSANLLTTRSDVFEILVTVQAGYGIDVEGAPAVGGPDGRIDYRSSNEFIVTAEKKTRTIYER